MMVGDGAKFGDPIVLKIRKTLFQIVLRCLVRIKETYDFNFTPSIDFYY